ncbi:hypothetical protein N9850_04445 [Granulosicoccus sp.]|nr:hypothetical protein [Granulosicoccus sp.]MDB4223000.1 hypothetical protein [Granulosicoccus sp.]
MSTSTPELTPLEWDAVFDRFLVSGLSQTDFCISEDLPRHRFAYRYRRSEKFAGTRKGSTQADATNGQKASGFRTVHKKPAAVVDSLGDESVSIHIGGDVRLQCPARVGVEAIVRLVREARS